VVAIDALMPKFKQAEGESRSAEARSGALED
jgi:hypothetical protein